MDNGAPGGTDALDGLLAEAEQLAHIGSWAVDLCTNRAVWSEGMYRIYGLEPGSVEPSRELVVEHTHPDDRERIRALLTAVLEHPETVPEEGLTSEYRAQRPDGSVREIRFRAHVARDGGGAPSRWTGVAQDVTEQRLTERELQARYAVTQALREWESFDEGVVSLLRRLGTALDHPLGLLWVWDEEESRIAVRASWSAPNVDARAFESATEEIAFRPGQGVVGQIWATGEPVLVEDVAEALQTSRRERAAELGLRSAIGFPARDGDRTLAVIAFYAFDRREPSDRLLLTLRGIGVELGRFLERRRGELGTRRPLSDRELEVLKLAAEGCSGPQIAERLFLSPTTVKTHFEHIYEKLGVGDRAAAVAHALRTGLIH